MRTTISIIFVSALLALAAGGCGSEIGDSCVLSSECSPAGDRLCATGSDLPGGYCTIRGCDFDTCPDESVCVRFFAVETNLPCASAAECSPEEFCTLFGRCVPRSAEIRFCMRKCESNDECRDNYECRDETLMIEHGGEPVLAPGENPDRLQPFCAAAPPS